MILRPLPGVSTQGIVAALIAAPAQLLENPDQRQPFASRFGRIGFQSLVKLARSSP